MQNNGERYCQGEERMDMIDVRTALILFWIRCRVFSNYEVVLLRHYKELVSKYVHIGTHQERLKEIDGGTVNTMM